MAGVMLIYKWRLNIGYVLKKMILFGLLQHQVSKYVSGLKRPLYTNAVAPEPKLDKNGLHTHFCQVLKKMILFGLLQHQVGKNGYGVHSYQV
jgi:hypothetical protein